jgi:hypothetical protein
MLRLRAFSGVKATSFFPPLLVLLADLRRRETSRVPGRNIPRPPLLGELFLIGILLAERGWFSSAATNVQFVPAFEVRMREFLERILVARPRNKEIFLGYPALLLGTTSARPISGPGTGKFSGWPPSSAFRRR